MQLTGHGPLGVCRPAIDLNEDDYFYEQYDTWMMHQYNHPSWALCCNTCAGTGMTLDPNPKMPDGSRVG